jgi:hypothetical protein
MAMSAIFQRYRILIAVVGLSLSVFVAVQIPRGLVWAPFLANMHLYHSMGLPIVVSIFIRIPRAAFVALGIVCGLLTLICIAASKHAAMAYIQGAVLLVLLLTVIPYQVSFVPFADLAAKNIAGPAAR